MAILYSILILVGGTVLSTLLYVILTKPQYRINTNDVLDIKDAVKKQEVGEVGAYRLLAFSTGLLIALSFVWYLVEYKAYEEIPVIPPKIEETVENEILEIPPTEHLPPPPPAKVVYVDPEFEEVDDDTEDDKLPDVRTEDEIKDLDPNKFNFNPPTTLSGPPDIPPPPLPKPVMYVDAQAEYPGGLQAMYDFTYDNYTYSQNFVDAGVTGHIDVMFVVELDGTVTQPRILKGINEELDNEAIRVVKLFKNFKPAVNKGNPVRSYHRFRIKLE